MMTPEEKKQLQKRIRKDLTQQEKDELIAAVYNILLREEEPTKKK